MTDPRKADRPGAEAGKQYHLHVSPGDLPPTVLLPGDPGRVPVLAELWDDVSEVAYHREYRSMRGTYRGVALGACSTGIGGPSTEIAINELAAIGCTTFLRLGTTGSLQESMRAGDVVISTGAVRWDGAADAYAPEAYPAVASYEVVLALISACERLGLRYHLGISATVASFYTAQSRAAFGEYAGLHPNRVEELRAMGVLNFDMETATVFVLSSLFGLRGGAVCVVIGDRFRNEWRPEGADEALARIGAETAVALAGQDERKRAAGKQWYSPELES